MSRLQAILKKGVNIVIVLFLAWFVFTDPVGAGTMTRSIVTTLWDLLQQLFTSLSAFLNAVTR